MNSLDRALNKVCKWRAIFAGWQLGTRSTLDPESQAVRDHREMSILLRVEMNALVGLLVDKGGITLDEWGKGLEYEANMLNLVYQKRFPGMRATDDGMVLTSEAAETMKGWRSRSRPQRTVRIKSHNPIGIAPPARVNQTTW